MQCSNPDGAFYVYPSVAGCIGKTSAGGVLIKDDEAFALSLLAEEGVATVHGAAFCFPGYIRISYANATEDLREACSRIQRFCQGLH
jgi:aspartate aminotransferase